MYNPNDSEDARLEQAFHVGDIVHFKPVTHDEFDRPVNEPPTRLTIVRVGNSRTDFDYEVKSPTGNHFYVKLEELAEDCVVAGSVVRSA
ncbi:MAG: hypothetical protein ACYDER_25585 [Ktedonobacteraceae bacterium]